LVDLGTSNQANQGSLPVRATNDNTNRATLINNVICEAFGCSAKATNKIAVEVGDSGAISLLLCDRCRPKFRS
jgi:hypothetical protein